MGFGPRKKVVFEGITEDVLKKAAVLVDTEAYFVASIDRRGIFRYGLKFRNNDPDNLLFMQEHFGGYWWEQPLDAGGTLYYLSIQQHRSRMVMRTLRDHLVGKKQIYLELEEYFDLIKGNKKKRLTPETKKSRQEKVNALRKLNLDSLGLTGKEKKADQAKS